MCRARPLRRDGRPGNGGLGCRRCEPRGAKASCPDGVESLAFYDAYTTNRFQTAHGRPLHTFLTPNDDPSVNGYVDANFLRQTVKDHVDAIRAYVLASHPAVKFEVLWPLDVNDPATRRLNRYINLPLEWESKPASGFDTFLIEGFQFAGIDRNLDKVRWMAGYPFEVLAWPRADCRYLMGLFNAGWPWERDYLAGRRSRTPDQDVGLRPSVPAWPGHSITDREPYAPVVS